MPLNIKPADHPKFPPHGRTGLLLVNLGTPEGTDKKSMRKYLKQFLSDARVIEVWRPRRALRCGICGPVRMSARPSNARQHV